MKRPTSVTVFGILNIVFAALGFCGVAGSAMMFAVPADQADPATAAMIRDSTVMTYTKISMVVGSILSIILLLGGIGLLLMKPWGRTLSIVWAAVGILNAVAGLAFTFLYLVPLLTKGAEGSDSPEAMGGAVGGMIGGTCGGILGLAYPIVLLIFMMRPNVKAAFGPAPDVVS